MSFERRNRKPCIYSGCDGTMRFSKYARQGQLEVSAEADPGPNVLPIRDVPGWVCDTDARHFEAAAADVVWHV